MKLFLNIPKNDSLVLKNTEEEKHLILISESGGGRSTAKYYEIGEGLKVEEDVLKVDTATEVEIGNSKPVESNAVYNHVAEHVGNIAILLSTI